MVDQMRIAELKQEIGEADLILVLGMFLSEAEQAIARIAAGLDDDSHAKATHFLRSGALNIGLTSLAAQADVAAAVPPTDRTGSAKHLLDSLQRSVGELGLPIPMR